MIDDALDVVIAAGRTPRWRYLCLEHPDAGERAKNSAYIIRLASPPDYPSFATQFGTAALAGARVVAAVVTGEPIVVSADVVASRQAVCDACEFYDVVRRRCTKCGCGGLKLHLATEKCPIEKW